MNHKHVWNWVGNGMYFCMTCRHWDVPCVDCHKSVSIHARDTRTIPPRDVRCRDCEAKVKTLSEALTGT